MRDAFLRISLPLPFLFRHPRLFPSVIPDIFNRESSVFVFAFVAAPSLVKARDMPSGACRFRSFGKRMRGALPAWYNFIAGHDFQIKIKRRKVRCEFNGP